MIAAILSSLVDRAIDLHTLTIVSGPGQAMTMITVLFRQQLPVTLWRKL